MYLYFTDRDILRIDDRAGTMLLYTYIVSVSVKLLFYLNHWNTMKAERGICKKWYQTSTTFPLKFINFKIIHINSKLNVITTCKYIRDISVSYNYNSIFDFQINLQNTKKLNRAQWLYNIARIYLEIFSII